MKTAFILFFILLMYATTAKSQQTFNSLNVKDLASNRVLVTSTTQGSKPCPAMTETQRNAIASPLIGQCIYNSTSLKLNVYNGSLWKSAGGGIENWVTAFAYAIGDVVIESFKIYQANTAHTSSGAFVTDIANWNQLAYNVSDATGVLPLANGGTNKNITASNGSIPYSDADSFEMLAAGTSGQFLKSNGAAAPSWAENTITAKAQNGTSQTLSEIQVPNNSLTQTDTNKHLIETGNSNILANPSFEHSTFSTSWTNSAGTFTQETSVLISGKASAKLVLAAQTASLTQSSTLYAAQFADGVQGLAMVRIKSDIALSVCSIQAGTVSTVNCVTTATDSKWGLYKIPFILGGTSNGISIASSGSVTGTVYIDDAFVGANSLNQDVAQSNQYLLSTSSTATPTLTTVTQSSGSGLFSTSGGVITALKKISIDASYSMYGIASGTSAWNISIVKGANTVGQQSNEVVNNGVFAYLSTSASVTLDIGDSLTFSRSVVAGAITSPSHYVSIVATEFIPVSTYSSQCGANCVDTFSAYIAAAGTVTKENVSTFITGDCTKSGTSSQTGTCAITGFTVVPNCTCSIENTPAINDLTCAIDLGASTASSLVYYTTNNGAASSKAVNISCQKQGADFTASRTIVGSFKEVMVATGVTKPKTCYYAFGGASATLAAPTECTTGTCVEVYDSCNAFSPPAWVTTATYTNLVMANGTFASTSPLLCTCQAFDTSANQPRDCPFYFDTSDSTWATNSSGGATLNIQSTNQDSAQTSYVMFSCEGSAP